MTQIVIQSQAFVLQCELSFCDWVQWVQNLPGMGAKLSGGGCRKSRWWVQREEQPVFTILTRAPAPQIAFIHDRMPVILPRGVVRDWLNPDYHSEELLNSAVLDVGYQLA